MTRRLPAGEANPLPPFDVATQKLHPKWFRRRQFLIRLGMTELEARARVLKEVREFRHRQFVRGGQLPDLEREFPEDLKVG